MAAFLFYGDVTFAQTGNIYVRRTCSGEQAAPLADNYVFGLKDGRGACSTMSVVANSYDEALACVKKLCPNCDVEDITGEYTFSTAAGLKNYCPAKR